MSTPNILLYEPQCLGFEHAAFNAALLSAVRLAYPQNQIVFCAEASHIREVEQILAAQPIPNITWRETAIPPRQRGNMRRLAAETRMLGHLLRQAKNCDTSFVLLCSSTEATIVALKQQMRRESAEIPVFVVLHGILRSLDERRWLKPWRWGLSLRQTLQLPHPPQLHYLMLGDSILQHAQNIHPAFCGQASAFDMPYLWTRDAASIPDQTNLRFGYFGSTAKGFDQFYQLAKAAKTENKSVSFDLVGFLSGRSKAQNYDDTIVQGLSSQPLSWTEYSERAEQTSYAIWIANPQAYNLTASASFLDALSYVKPIIYLANPYIDSYFAKLGYIGYRCENFEEMQSVVLDLARSFPAERYAKQCEAILQGRKLFEPATVAQTLRKICGQQN